MEDHKFRARKKERITPPKKFSFSTHQNIYIYIYVKAVCGELVRVKKKLSNLTHPTADG
jgi:hypothetical protein